MKAKFFKKKQMQVKVVEVLKEHRIAEEAVGGKWPNKSKLQLVIKKEKKKKLTMKQITGAKKKKSSDIMEHMELSVRVMERWPDYWWWGWWAE